MKEITLDKVAELYEKMKMFERIENRFAGHTFYQFCEWIKFQGYKMV